MARQFHCAFKFRAGIVAFKAGMFAVEQGGGQYFISIRGIFIAQFTDMIGDAKYLLDEDKATAPFACRLDMIDGDLRTIGHFHLDHRAHNLPSGC